MSLKILKRVVIFSFWVFSQARKRPFLTPLARLSGVLVEAALNLLLDSFHLIFRKDAEHLSVLGFASVFDFSIFEVEEA